MHHACMLCLHGTGGPLAARAAAAGVLAHTRAHPRAAARAAGPRASDTAAQQRGASGSGFPAPCPPRARARDAGPGAPGRVRVLLLPGPDGEPGCSHSHAGLRNRRPAFGDFGRALPVPAGQDPGSRELHAFILRLLHLFRSVWVAATQACRVRTPPGLVHGLVRCPSPPPHTHTHTPPLTPLNPPTRAIHRRSRPPTRARRSLQCGRHPRVLKQPARHPRPRWGGLRGLLSVRMRASGEHGRPSWRLLALLAWLRGCGCGVHRHVRGWACCAHARGGWGVGGPYWHRVVVQRVCSRTLQPARTVAGSASRARTTACPHAWCAGRGHNQHQPTQPLLLMP